MAQRLTPPELDALEAAHKAATQICGEKITSHHIVSPGYEHMANLCRENMGCITMTYKEESDAIAAAYTALPALLAEIHELRSLTTPEVIGEKHRDGEWWLVWCAEHWLKCRWSKCGFGWQMFGTATYIVATPTHATALPPAPEEAPNDKL